MGILSTKSELLVLELHGKGKAVKEIVAATHIAYSAIRDCIERGRPRTREEREKYEGHIPTPEEIAIRASILRTQEFERVMNECSKRKKRPRISKKCFISDTPPP